MKTFYYLKEIEKLAKRTYEKKNMKKVAFNLIMIYCLSNTYIHKSVRCILIKIY